MHSEQERVIKRENQKKRKDLSKIKKYKYIMVKCKVFYLHFRN